MIGRLVRETEVSCIARGARTQRMRSLRYSRCIAAAAFLLSTSMVIAAESAPTKPESSSSSAFVCLSNTAKDGQRQPLVIAVSPDKAQTFLARGFERARCDGIKPIGSEAKRSICEVARARDPAVNLYFWQRFSLTPEEICQVVSAARGATANAP